MHRVAKFSWWRKHKRPRDGQSYAKSCRCLSNHFHRSGLEGRVCDELRLKKIAGDIKDYETEVTLQLSLAGCNLGTYRIDFKIQENDGSTTYLEAKGIEFPLWKQKFKILEAMHRDNPMIHLVVVKK